jgi:hypothetical protein
MKHRHRLLLSAIAAALASSALAADPVSITITMSPKDFPVLGMQGYNLSCGTSPTGLDQKWKVPAASQTAPTPFKISLQPADRWYCQAQIYEAAAEGAWSPILSFPVGTVVPVPTKRLITVDSKVYNTGSFDPASWRVRPNKLVGSIGLGKPCDATKPATGEFYRVPTASVTWLGSTRTSYPLAMCKLL